MVRKNCRHFKVVRQPIETQKTLMKFWRIIVKDTMNHLEISDPVTRKIIATKATLKFMF